MHEIRRLWFYSRFHYFYQKGRNISPSIEHGHGFDYQKAETE